METVLHALKAMGKANSVELAARIDISREEVLNELWELKKNGVVKRVTPGFWLSKVNPG
ncbi:Lrp/AsnC family transcriptional regulator [Escherichia coli]|nr:Lrp/AsnC family transcriptional regulator [Escherichia coli]EEW8013340.1 Lrp/AsnC family transcriptional regulator [Escherichia coli]EEX0781388.1 Lrp/AsnC family transcriptional regulator [Escherichia coli]EEX9329404.1 Lrp/AsnC family transcriptional regulator [Escherichia coli]EEZ8338795.1 Lrp/AsnC family transcriptional regulator [Escherichia coli]